MFPFRFLFYKSLYWQTIILEVPSIIMQHRNQLADTG